MRPSQIFQHYSDASAIATEAISNIRTVRAVSSEEYEIGRYAGSMREALAKGVRDAIFGSLSAAFNNYLDLGAGVLILWYGGTIAMRTDGSITVSHPRRRVSCDQRRPHAHPAAPPAQVGSLIKYQLYWNMLNNAMQSLNNVLNVFTRAAGAADRVLTLVDLKPDLDPTRGAPVDVAVARWDVGFEGVVFRYQMRPMNTVLSGMSFHVPDGSVAALVGKSGGGKSTIVHLLLRFYDPLEGRVTFGGVDYRDLCMRSVHQKVGVVSQDAQMFNATVAENIAYGLEPHDFSHDDLVVAAQAAQAHKFITDFEDGFETRVGERGQRLSGGQKQRIAIARCLLRKPKLLLLDEATSSLDTESEAAVQKALDSLIWQVGGYTVVLVAHRLSTVVNAGQIVVVEGGQAVEVGQHDELLRKGGVYKSLVEHQLQRQREALSETSAAAAADAPAAK